jgi:hypothetical protein
MEEEKDDPFKLVRMGLARPSQLHPSHMIRWLAARLGVKALSDIAKGLKHNDGERHDE